MRSRRMPRQDQKWFASMKLYLSAHATRPDRAFRQYDAVDPGNRQVAGELERRWNERLVAVQTAEDALNEACEACADMRMDEAGAGGLPAARRRS